MSTLYPCLVPAIMSNLFPSPVLVLAIMSTFLSLSWCSPCQVNLVSRNLMLAIMTTLCPPSWFKQSCPDCTSHFLNLMSPPRCSVSCQTWVPFLVSAIILTLCSLFGTLHQVRLVSLPWCLPSCQPCVTYFNNCHHVHFVYPSWCPL